MRALVRHFPLRLKKFQDGCTVECTTGEIWRALAFSAQNRRTELPPWVPVSVPCHTRDQSSCSRYSPVAKSARMDNSHRAVSFISLFVHIAFLNHTYYFPSFQGEQLLAMTYGYEAKWHHDKTIDAAKKLSDIGTRASLPGSLLVSRTSLYI
jgi:hypothetical protein